MALRLRRTVAGSGLSDAAVLYLDRAFRVALEKRVRAFPEPHAQFLHAARTALILLTDVGLTERGAIAAALLFDSRYVALSTSAEEARELGFADAAAYLAQFPVAGLEDAELLEALVVLDATALAVVLAERLDHARHVQFSPSGEWPAFHRQILDVYLPLARRSGVLAARLDAWAEAFGRRLARGAGGSYGARGARGRATDRSDDNSAPALAACCHAVHCLKFANRNQAAGCLRWRNSR